VTCHGPPPDTQPPCSHFQKLPIALLLRIDCLHLFVIRGSAINTLAAPRLVFEDLKPIVVALPDSDLLQLRSLKMHRLLLTQTILLTSLVK
jgi:hypothetical protein